MKGFQLDTDRLRNGTWVARPAGQLGSMGWYPFPWTAAFARTEKAAIAKFDKQHSK